MSTAILTASTASLPHTMVHESGRNRVNQCARSTYASQPTSTTRTFPTTNDTPQLGSRETDGSVATEEERRVTDGPCVGSGESRTGLESSEGLGNSSFSNGEMGCGVLCVSPTMVHPSCANDSSTVIVTSLPTVGTEASNDTQTPIHSLPLRSQSPHHSSPTETETDTSIPLSTTEETNHLSTSSQDKAADMDVSDTGEWNVVSVTPKMETEESPSGLEDGEPLQPLLAIMPASSSSSPSSPPLLLLEGPSVTNPVPTTLDTQHDTTNNNNDDGAPELGLLPLFGDDDTTDTIEQNTSTNDVVNASHTPVVHNHSLSTSNHNRTSHKGLLNLGNTCYMNSALQMIMSVEEFVTEVIALYHERRRRRRNETAESKKPSLIKTNNESEMETEMELEEEEATEDPTLEGQPESSHETESKKQPLLDALAEFFLSVDSIHHHNPNPTADDRDGDNRHSSTNDHGPADPSELKRVVDQLTPQFIGFRQQDSHEFLSTLLDLLHEELKPQPEPQPEPEPEPVAVDKPEPVAVVKPDTESEGGGNDQTDSNGTTSTCSIEETDKSRSDDKTDTNNTTSVASQTMDRNSVTTTTTTNTTTNKMTRCHSSSLLKGLFDDVTDDASVEDTVPMEEEEPKVDGYIVVHKPELVPTELPVGETTEDTTETESLSDEFVERVLPLNDEPIVTTERTVPKAGSYAELDVQDIDALLHGTRVVDKTTDMDTSLPLSLPPPTTTSETNHPNVTDGCKLVGGRIAPVPTNALSLCVESHGLVDGGTNRENEGERQIEAALLVQSVVMGDEDENDVEGGGEPTVPPHEEDGSNQQCETTLVDKYFTTEIRTHLTCDSCKFSRSHLEVFRHLSIDVGSSSSSSSTIGTTCAQHHDPPSVQEGLRQFFAPEKIEIKCEKCFCESATQTMEIVRLPKVMVVHLKRFIMDVSPCFSRVSFRKNKDAVDFGETLGLDPSDNVDGTLGEYLSVGTKYPQCVPCGTNDCGDWCKVNRHTRVESEDGNGEITMEDDYKYNIRSVVHHIGSSANCGHYTADAMKLDPDTKERGWHKFNDSIVSTIETEKALGDCAKRNAYMIMYVYDRAECRIDSN